MAIAGIPVTMGDGEKYVIAPLTLGALEDFGDALNAMNDMTPDSIRSAIDIAHASLKRNYPDMTRAQVRELVDLANMDEVMTACMDISGLKRKEYEAEQAEADAGEPAGA